MILWPERSSSDFDKNSRARVTILAKARQSLANQNIIFGKITRSMGYAVYSQRKNIFCQPQQ